MTSIDSESMSLRLCIKHTIIKTWCRFLFCLIHCIFNLKHYIMKVSKCPPSLAVNVWAYWPIGNLIDMDIVLSKKKLMIWTLHPVYLYVHLFFFFFFQTINTSLICENYFWYFNCGGGIIYVIIIQITIICVSFVFNNRVMRYNACIYYMLNCVRVSSTSQTTHNYELRLKHFKCSFHILLG